jgi:hypothetical protein
MEEILRFEELLSDIENHDNIDYSGKWIKATVHSNLFNIRHSDHDDIDYGWDWFKEIIENYRKRNILIYKIGNRNWFVLPDFNNEFELKYPSAFLKAI